MSAQRQRQRAVGFVGSAAALTLALLLGACASSPTPPRASVTTAPTLAEPTHKRTAMQLVSAAENGTLDWEAQYSYIEDIGDGRGYTAGIIGFTSGTGDLLEVVTNYLAAVPDAPIGEFVPALTAVNGSDSHAGLDPGFTSAWEQSAADPRFHEAQDAIRDREYFTPAVTAATHDGLRALGQFAYYDAYVMHGDSGFEEIRQAALAAAQSPAQGGSETSYLEAFFTAREHAMRAEPAHEDTSRVTTAQRRFLAAGNLDLDTPLEFEIYGDHYVIPQPEPRP